MGKGKLKRRVGIGMAAVGLIVMAVPRPYDFGNWSHAIGLALAFAGIGLLGPGGLFGLRGQPPGEVLKVPAAEVARQTICPEERRRALYGVAVALFSLVLVMLYAGFSRWGMIPFEYQSPAVILIFPVGAVAGLFLVNPYLQCLWRETGPRRRWGR